jgi:hypothetical protein
MTPTLFYRIAAMLLVFFAVTHTFGLLGSQKPAGESARVRKEMDSVRFQYMGKDCTWGGFYIGFGLFVTAYLLFTAFLAWYLGGVTQRDPVSGFLGQIHPRHVKSLAWAFFTVQAICSYLGYRYFFMAPAVVSTLIALCLGLAAWRV